MNIYIGNLSYRTGDSELRDVFERFGQVDAARIIEDKDTQRSRGFGFVEMTTAPEAQRAIAELNGTELEGRTITVNEARAREERRTQR